ncbi:MAG: hypothetical protein WC484_00025 [Candidatus Omnitrophota bacterium]
MLYSCLSKTAAYFFRNRSRPANFWEKVRKNRPLFFVHIPKTAGHSVYDLLKRNYPKDAVVMPYQGVEGNLKTLLSLTADEQKKIKVVAAHMPVGLHKLFGECTYMTFLRGPLDRVLSSYYFSAESQDAPTYFSENCQNKTLLQFAENFDNVMTRFLISCEFTEATFWLSGETNPFVKRTSFLGLECDKPTAVRTIALRQWNNPYSATRYPSIGGVKKVSVEYSEDCFTADIRTAALLTLKQGHGMYFYSIPDCEKARFWRIRALSGPQTARWGVVALKFFEQERRLIPVNGYEDISAKGVPICSSAMQKFPAKNAFDGHDRRALWQIPPGSLERRHCEEAIENLRERFLIGLTERYNESVDLIGSLLGWTDKPIKRLNAGSSKRNVTILSNYERKELAKINRFDLIIYQYARKLFQSDLDYLRKHR